METSGKIRNLEQQLRYWESVIECLERMSAEDSEFHIITSSMEVCDVWVECTLGDLKDGFIESKIDQYQKLIKEARSKIEQIERIIE